MLLPGSRYPLYYPQYISGYEKVKITTTKQTNTMETEPLTRGIVIFGATGDLCKRKLIPALHKLWEKGPAPTQQFADGLQRLHHPIPGQLRGSSESCLKSLLERSEVLIQLCEQNRDVCADELRGNGPELGKPLAAQKGGNSRHLSWQ